MYLLPGKSGSSLYIYRYKININGKMNVIFLLRLWLDVFDSPLLLTFRVATYMSNFRLISFIN